MMAMRRMGKRVLGNRGAYQGLFNTKGFRGANVSTNQNGGNPLREAMTKAQQDRQRRAAARGSAGKGWGVFDMFRPGQATQDALSNVRGHWGRRQQAGEQVRDLTQQLTTARGAGDEALTGNLTAQLQNAQQTRSNALWDAAGGVADAGWNYLREPNSWGGRIARGAGASFALGTGARMLTGRGGPVTKDGRFDIAGIPFI